MARARKQAAKKAPPATAVKAPELHKSAPPPPPPKKADKAPEPAPPEDPAIVNVQPFVEQFGKPHPAMADLIDAAEAAALAEQPPLC